MNFFGYDLSTGDFLNISLSIGFLAIAIVLVMVLIRTYKILGKVEEISGDVQEILETVRQYLWQPARVMMEIFEKVKRFLGRKKK